VAVLNEAISGNRVLNDFIGPNAGRRIDRDVLTQGGLTYVVLLLGTNDLGFSQLAPGTFPGVSLANVSAAEIISGYEQIILRAHQAGARIYGATVLPFEGAGYHDAAVEPKRAALNPLHPDEWGVRRRRRLRRGDARPGAPDAHARRVRQRRSPASQ